MRRSLLAILLLPLTGCAGIPRAPQIPFEEPIDGILTAYAQPGVPGASVLVRHEGAILVAKEMGLADVASGARSTASTNYRLATR